MFDSLCFLGFGVGCGWVCVAVGLVAMRLVLPWVWLP